MSFFRGNATIKGGLVYNTPIGYSTTGESDSTFTYAAKAKFTDLYTNGNILHSTTFSSKNFAVGGTGSVSLTSTDTGTGNFVLASSGDMSITAGKNGMVIRAGSGSSGGIVIDTTTNTGTSISIAAQTSLALSALTSYTLTANTISATGTASVTVDSSGAINIGTTNSSGVTIGRSGTTVTVPGNLTVSGTTTFINTTNTQISDNLLKINAASSAGKDGGAMITRHPDDITTDAVKDTSTVSGVTSASVFAIGLSSTTIDYTGGYIKFTSGTNSGTYRQITSHSSTSITVASAFGASPTIGDAVELYNGNNTAIFYDESADEWVLAYTVNDDTVSAVTTSRTASLRVNNLNVTGSINASSYSLERVTASATGTFASPGSTISSSTTTAPILSFVSVSGAANTYYFNLAAATGIDGKVKIIQVSSLANAGTIVVVKGAFVNADGTAATQLSFDTVGQGAHLVWDNTAASWKVINSGGTFS